MPKKKKILKKRASKKTVLKRKVSRKKVIRKAPKKALASKKAKSAKKAKENIIGTITHYFPKVRAAVIKLKGPLAVGDTVKIKGHTTDLTQRVSSMQIDRVAITIAKKGDEIGLLVDSRVRQNDTVCKI